jgi:DNA-binding NarL/FixJ family response regulator
MNVLIADDHPIFRTSLRQVLADLADSVTVVEAADFDEAIDIATKRDDLDLALIDLMMPGKDPIEGLQAVVRALPEVPVVVVSAIENRRDAVQTINLGAMGYIPKTVDHQEFTKMLRVVLDGGLCLPRNMSTTAPTTAPRPAVEYERLATNELLTGLTKRQLQVLALLAQGKSNVEIAGDLGVSDKTIRFYISAILKTLKVRNRTQAALIAARAIGDSPVRRTDSLL